MKAKNVIFVLSLFLDRQLEFINPRIVRSPGQSTYAFLTELQEMANLTELDGNFIERLSFMHEACRFRTVSVGLSYFF